VPDPELPQLYFIVIIIVVVVVVVVIIIIIIIIIMYQCTAALYVYRNGTWSRSSLLLHKWTTISMNF